VRLFSFSFLASLSLTIASCLLLQSAFASKTEIQEDHNLSSRSKERQTRSATRKTLESFQEARKILTRTSSELVRYSAAALLWESNNVDNRALARPVIFGAAQDHKHLWQFAAILRLKMSRENEDRAIAKRALLNIVQDEKHPYFLSAQTFLESWDQETETADSRHIVGSNSFLSLSSSSDPLTARKKSALSQYKKAPKYLVHIGFNNGLPKNGMMEPGWDPSIYFSLNFPFPRTKLMSKLDHAPYIVIVPYTAEMASRTLSFHPTEVLIAEPFAIGKDAYVVAPRKARIPSYYSNTNIEYYEGSDIQARNAKAYEVLRKLKVPHTELILDRNESWNNNSQALATVEGIQVNVNEESLYEDISPLRAAYSCPACCFNEAGKLQGIGLVSELKGVFFTKDSYNEKMNKALFIRSELERWVQTLTHLDENVRVNFMGRVDKMIKSQQSLRSVVFSFGRSLVSSFRSRLYSCIATIAEDTHGAYSTP
jgi:hypothetical protein